MKKKLILMTMMLIGILTMWSSAYAADLVITTEAQLQAFASAVNSGTTYSGKTVELGGNVTLTSAHTPIGTASYPFAGTFDGKGYTISGLSINTYSGYIGLFGYTSSTATIKNVTVSGSITASSYAGGIVGYSTGTIDNCINYCSVSGRK